MQDKYAELRGGFVLSSDTSENEKQLIREFLLDECGAIAMSAEDAEDLKDALAAKKVRRKGTISWEQIKADLNL
jgi:hypothetical protein